MRGFLWTIGMLAVCAASAQTSHSFTFKVGQGSAKPAIAADAKARKLLEQSLGRFPVANVRTIIMQRVDYGSEVMQQIKVEMSPAGKLHQLVIAPLRFQGFETVDDGDSVRTYSPDDQSVIVQPSSKQTATDMRFRMSLVDRNYRLRVDGKETIAGRTAVVVAAVPKNDDLETRCYAIDEKTGFLLRLQTCRENAAPVVHFEAKMIEFPASFPERTFRFDAQGAYVQKYVSSCYKSPSPALRSELGFEPIVPTSLPYGFALQELQAETDAKVPAVAVRLTDGLAKATVYQWEHRGSGPSGAPRGTLVATTGRVTLLIYGDLPDSVKDRILQSFVRAARDRSWTLPELAMSWAQELRCDLGLFSLDRESVGLVPNMARRPEFFNP